MMSWQPTRRAVVAGGITAALPFARRRANAEADIWPQLAADLFKDRPLADGSSRLALEMPVRAEDAAVVPLTVRLTAAGQRVKALTLVIDGNPAPVAASFELGSTAGVTGISTRVRVNSYTDVHAVAELENGELYAVQTFVKASGGCSAPMLNVASEGDAAVGQMRFKLFAQPSMPVEPTQREAALMIRHPNNSGLQMDPLTHLYIPAYFVRELKIWQGSDLVLAMTGGISLSQNPQLRFTYRPNGAAMFRAQAVDTKEQIFSGEWPAAGSQS